MNRTTSTTGSTSAQGEGGGGAVWPVVAVREILVKLRDRNFLISTGFTILLLVGIFGFQAFMASRTSTVQVAVTDQAASRVVQQAAPHVGDNTTVTTTQVGDDAAARAALEAGTADAYLHRTGQGWALTSKDSPDSSLAGAVGEVVRSEALTANAARVGTSVAELQRGAELATETLHADAGSSEQKAVRFISSLVFAMLFYMAALMFGLTIANSVVEEKQSRIVEILATAIPVRSLLIGKVIGNTVLALAQMVLFTGVGLIGMRFTPYSGYLTMLTGPVAWYLAFFLLGFLALACIWAAAGALASRSEDVQSTTMPLTILMVVVLFAGVSLEGVEQVIASYVPVFSVVAMPARLVAGTAQVWEPVLSLGLTAVFAAAMIWVGERMYRRSVFKTSGRMSFTESLTAAE